MLIDFLDNLNKVLMRKFSMPLPSVIKDKVDYSNNHTDNSHSVTSSKTLGKLKIDNVSSSCVENKGKLDAWIVNQGEYDRHFCHNNSVLSKHPKFQGGVMCHCWHSKGYCFENCNNKDSHVPSSDLPKEQKEQYEDWCSKCN